MFKARHPLLAGNPVRGSALCPPFLHPTPWQSLHPPTLPQLDRALPPASEEGAWHSRKSDGRVRPQECTGRNRRLTRRWGHTGTETARADEGKGKGRGTDGRRVPSPSHKRSSSHSVASTSMAGMGLAVGSTVGVDAWAGVGARSRGRLERGVIFDMRVRVGTVSCRHALGYGEPPCLAHSKGPRDRKAS